MALREFVKGEGILALHALLCQWKAKMRRTFLPFAVITSQWSVGAHTLSQNQRQTDAPHTAERTKPLRPEVSSERPHFTILSPGRALTPVTVWSGCSYHTTALQFSGSSRSLDIFKMCGTTAKLLLFHSLLQAGEQTGCPAAAASDTLLPALCLSL